MKRVSVKGVRPIIKNHPVSGRLLVALSLVTSPASWVFMSLKETWPDYREEFSRGVKLVFLPWDK